MERNRHPSVEPTRTPATRAAPSSRSYRLRNRVELAEGRSEETVPDQSVRRADSCSASPCVPSFLNLHLDTHWAEVEMSRISFSTNMITNTSYIVSSVEERWRKGGTSIVGYPSRSGSTGRLSHLEPQLLHQGPARLLAPGRVSMTCVMNSLNRVLLTLWMCLELRASGSMERRECM